jgi:hypothetical protein
MAELRLEVVGPCWRPGCVGTIVRGRIMRWCQRCKTTGLA